MENDVGNEVEKGVGVGKEIKIIENKKNVIE